MAKKRRRKTTQSRRHATIRRNLAARKGRDLHFECLEPRDLLAGVTVGNATDLVNAPDTSSIAALIADDGGDGISLREAITAANNTVGSDNISFSASLSGSTISLGGTELAVSDSLVIDGTNLPAGLTIDAQSNSRVVNFTSASGDLTLSGLTVTGGRVTGAGEDGGGILFGGDGTLTLQAVTVAGNRTEGSGFADGGGIHAATGNVSIQSSTISGNQAESNGGGVYVSAGSLSVVNSTVSGNQASGSFGGGIIAGGALTVESSTIVRNQLGSNYGFGGGIQGSGTINNSIVAENSDNPSPGEDSVADLFGSFSGNFNLVGIGDSVSGNNNQTGIASAGLGALANNGGPTQTHAVLRTSPALNAGDPNFDPQSFSPALNNDQRGAGFLRLRGTVDIGAFELQNELPSLIVDSGSSVVDAGDFVTTLPEAINFANSNPGADVITLLTDVTLTSVNNSNTLIGSNGTPLANNGLPVITSQITIEGGGFTVGRESSAPDFRILEIASGGNLTIDNLTVAGGRAPRGGGILNEGRLVLNSSVVTGNRTVSADSALADGGGIANNPSGTLTVNNSQVTNNYAYRDGGGIHNEGNAFISSSTISGNIVDQSIGGGVANQGSRGNLTILDSTISGNQADEGGGVGISGGNQVISNSTISGNRTNIGGGVYAAFGTLTLNNTTVTANEATGQGGGIFLLDTNDNLTVNLNQSLIAGNAANASGDEIRLVGGILNADAFNLLGHSGQSNADAFVGVTPGASDLVATSDGNIPTALTSIIDTTLADNGGTTLTHALVAESPAVDAATTGTANDQRGLSRPQGSGFDIGATEFNPPPVVASIERLDPTTETTNADNLVFRVTFSEAVIGVTGADDFVVSGGTATSDLGNVTSVTAVSDTIYDLTVASTEIANFNGAVGLDVNAGTDITDLLGAALTIAEPTIDQTYTLDNEGPTALLVSPTPSPTNLFDFPGQVVVNFADPAGIGSVELALRTPFNQFFDGTAFTAGNSQPIFLPAIDLGDGNFALQVDPSAFPFEQNYFVRARATDGLGNVVEADVPSFFGFTNELIVDTAVDESDGDFSVGDRSLREALELANASAADEVILFDSSVFNGEAADVIRLQLGQLTIADSVHINAGDLNVVISGDANGNDALVSGTFITDVAASDSAGVLADNNGRVLQVTAPGGSNVELTGITITGGNAAGIGGGVLSSYASLQIDRVTIAGNLASGSGGGVFASATLTDSTVSGNFSTASGGGIASASGAITLNRSTVSGNGSAASGGGVYTNYGNVSVTNSTISGNQSDSNGGGIYTVSAPVLIESSTITDNTAAQFGGGIDFSSTTPGGSLTARNSIIAGNSGLGLAFDFQAPSDPANNLSVSFSLIGTSFGTTLTAAPTGDASGNLIGGLGGTSIDPLLGPLDDNGGLTQTHALLPGSAAFNAGDPSIVFDSVEFDQRGLGFARVVGPAIDIGAFERQTEVPSLIVNTSLDVIDDTDFVTSLPEAILFANSSPGADTITLLNDVLLTTIGDVNDNFGPSGLPLLNSEITIEGGGFTIARSAVSGTPEFRILRNAGNLTINDTTISGGLLPNLPPNSGTSNGYDGGGILNTGLLTINRSTISGNRTASLESVANGGGIATLAAGQTTINQSEISGNYSYANGGGLYNSAAGTLTVNDSLIVGNIANDEYGGGISSLGTLQVNNSTISGNRADESGGGIAVRGGVATVNSTTITQNNQVFSGFDGGGIDVTGGTLNLNNSLVAGNLSGGQAVEIRVAGGTVNADSFNLFGHSGITGAQAFSGFTPGATDITATSDGTTPTALSSILNTALADNGGPTRTHSLVAGSPAIDAANSSLATDQRGESRPVDFAVLANATGGNGSDIGAVELQTEPSSLIVTTAVDVVDANDFVTSLREAIAFANTNPGVDTITFDAGVFNGELADLIRLTGGELSITDAIVIDGGQAGVVITGDAAGDDTVDAQGITTGTINDSDNSRVFEIQHASGESILQNLTITGGVAEDEIVFMRDGGGILTSADLRLVNSRITGNFAEDSGGGISSSATVNIVDSVVDNNYAAVNGGGVSGGAINILRGQVRNNTAGSSSGGAGGVDGTFVNITDSSITGNTTVGNVGGVRVSSTAIVSGSTISGNSADYYTGGLDAFNATISNSTITQNRSGTSTGPGGLEVENLTLINSIVAGNFQSSQAFDLTISNTSDIRFSLIGTNFGTSLTESQTPDANGNLIGGSVGGTIDPLLGGLANNGGPTLTHALLPGSLAVNAGDLAAVAGQNGVPLFDQRGTGFDRVIGGRIDIGAFESTFTPPPQIVDVIVGGSSFSPAFIDAADGGGAGAGNGLGLSVFGADQLRTVPFTGIDTLYLQFSSDVSASLTDGDIILTGTNGGTYSLGAISFDAATNIAAVPILGGVGGIANDSLVITIFSGSVSDSAGSALDGEFTTGQTTPSGDGTAGGQFDFFFNVLPGDVDGSQQVTAADAVSVFGVNSQLTSEANFRFDIDGSGQITTADAIAAFGTNGSGLPAAPTPPTPPSPIRNLPTRSLATPPTTGSALNVAGLAAVQEPLQETPPNGGSNVETQGSEVLRLQLPTPVAGLATVQEPLQETPPNGGSNVETQGSEVLRLQLPALNVAEIPRFQSTRLDPQTNDNLRTNSEPPRLSRDAAPSPPITHEQRDAFFVGVGEDQENETLDDFEFDFEFLDSPLE